MKKGDVVKLNERRLRFCLGYGLNLPEVNRYLIIKKINIFQVRVKNLGSNSYCTKELNQLEIDKEYLIEQRHNKINSVLNEI